MAKSRLLKKSKDYPAWLAVDLDGTLALAQEPFDPLTVGDPIPLMVAKVQKVLAGGLPVRIFTARMADEELADKIQQVIGDWTEEHIGTRLIATNRKDPGAVEIWDDRARRVEHKSAAWTPEGPRGALGFRQDNPAIRYPEDAEAGRAWLASHPRTTTGWYEKVMVAPAELIKLPGARNEHLRPDQDIIDNLTQSMKAEGFRPADSPLVVVEADGQPKIYEGNHRVRAAYAAGIPSIPVTVRYFGGSEEITGVWDPANLGISKAAGAVDPTLLAKAVKKWCHSNASFAFLETTAAGDSGWSDGGCWILADAIHKGFGGQLCVVRGLTREQRNLGWSWSEAKNQIQHFVVKFGSGYIDQDGMMSDKKLGDFWWKYEGVHVLAIEPYTPDMAGQAEGIPKPEKGDEIVAAIQGVLDKMKAKTAAAGSTPQITESEYLKRPIYRRNTRTPSPVNQGVGYTMWVRADAMNDVESDLDGYGSFRWELEPKKTISAEKLRETIEDKFLSDYESDLLPPALDHTLGTIKGSSADQAAAFLDEIDPEYITSSAGALDDLDFMRWLWENYEDLLWDTAIETQDGLVTFTHDTEAKPWLTYEEYLAQEEGRGPDKTAAAPSNITFKTFRLPHGYVVRAYDSIDPQLEDIGYIKLEKCAYDESMIFVSDVMVDSFFRSQGIGMDLYEKAIDLARRKGFSRFSQGTPRTPDAARVWARLKDKYAVKYNEEWKSDYIQLDEPAAKTAADFGYTKFNDRESELSRIEFFDYHTLASFSIDAEFGGKIVGDIVCNAFDLSADEIVKDEEGSEDYDPALHGATTQEAYAIERAQISPEWAGTGLGQMLYDEAVKQAASRGAKVLLSDSLRSPDARSAWRRLGQRYTISNRGDRKVLMIEQPAAKTAREGFNEDGFWSGDNGASGILPIARDTKRICLAWRSEEVHQGDCWGTIGGACKDKLSPEASAKAELSEETGYRGGIEMHPAYVFTSGSFRYANFIGVVDSEFSFNPGEDHGWETDFIEWMTLAEVKAEMKSEPGNFHPGMIALFKNSAELIERLAGEDEPVLEPKKPTKPKLLKSTKRAAVNHRYFYHGTSRSHLPGIIAEGLVPQSPDKEGWPEFDTDGWDDDDEDNDGWDDEVDPAGFELRTFATESFEQAKGYADNYPDGVVLRLPSDYNWMDGATDFPYVYTDEKIPATQIQVLEGKTWVPLVPPSPEKAKLLRRKASKMASVTYGPLYHGTEADFSASDIKPGPVGLIWFSDSREFAEQWGSNIIEAMVTITKPDVYEDSGLHMAGLDSKREVARLAKKYDGIIISNPSDPSLPTNYAVFSPSQVKVVTPKVASSLPASIQSLEDVLSMRGSPGVYEMINWGHAEQEGERIATEIGLDFSALSTQEQDALLDPWVKDQLQGRYEDILRCYQQPSLTVYRALDLEGGIEQVQAEFEGALHSDKGFGTCWSWSESGADTYCSEISGGGTKLTLRGRVSHDAVDWETSFQNNVINDEEKEIRLKKGAKVTIDGWRGEGETAWQAPPDHLNSVTASVAPASIISTAPAKATYGHIRDVPTEQLPPGARQMALAMVNSWPENDPYGEHPEGELVWSYGNAPVYRLVGEDDDHITSFFENEPEYMEELQADLRENGLREPILIFRGIEGNHRLAVFYDYQIKSIPALTGRFKKLAPKQAAADVTQSPAFQSWFSGSKVVDAQGRPLRMYHGTNESFSEFAESKCGISDEGWMGKGFYFTYNPDEASSYALSDLFGKGDSPNVVPVYLSIKNPLVIRMSVLPDGRTLKDMHDGTIITSKGSKAVRALAEAGGYDGILLENNEGRPLHVVAFKPNQIKSALGNDGSFDPDSKSITAATPEADALEVYAFGSVAAFQVQAVTAEGSQVGVIRCVEFDPKDPDAIEDPFEHGIENDEDEDFDEATHKDRRSGYAVYEAIVEPDWVGHGLGQKLYDRAILEAKRRGAHFLWSDERMSDDGYKAWDRLAKRYTVIRDGNLNRLCLSISGGGGKHASPDFGYSQFNDRDKDVKSLRIMLHEADEHGFEVVALAPGKAEEVDDFEGNVLVTPVLWPEPIKGAFVISEAFIKEEWRGTGLGQILYDRAIQEAKAQGGLTLSSGHTMSQDADNAWKRLSKRYPVTHKAEGLDDEENLIDPTEDEFYGQYTIDLTKVPAQSKAASPDFGYSQFNDRDADLAKVEITVENTIRNVGGFHVYAKFGFHYIAQLQVAVEGDDATVLYSAIGVDHRDAWKGTGLGQIMYDRAIQESKKRGCAIFSSDTDMSKDARSAWKRLAQRYPVQSMGDHYEIRLRGLKSKSKAAMPDFGYSKFNDREKDVNSLTIQIRNADRNGFEVVAIPPGYTVDDDMYEGMVMVSAKTWPNSVANAFVIAEANIDDAWKGTGLGQILYDHAIQEAKAQGGLTLSSGHTMSTDADSAWKRLSKRYPVTHKAEGLDNEENLIDPSEDEHYGQYTLDLSKVPAQSKTAMPDFGYSQFNDRVRDLAKLTWTAGTYNTRGFDLMARFSKGGTSILAGRIRCDYYPEGDLGHEDGQGIVYSSIVDVNPEFRGTGLGQMLYDRAIARAKEMGARWFSSDTSLTRAAVSGWLRLRKRYPVEEIHGVAHNADVQEDEDDESISGYRIDLNKVKGTAKAAAYGGSPALAAIVAKFESTGVSIDIFEDERSITLSSIRIPKESRKQGQGSAFMEELIDYADSVTKPVFLTPSKDFGATSVARLQKFYGRFGFKKNTGRNKDFMSREGMVRQPKKAKMLTAKIKEDGAKETPLPAEGQANVPNEWKGYEIRQAEPRWGQGTPPRLGPIEFLPVADFVPYDAERPSAKRKLIEGLKGKNPYFTAVVYDGSAEDGFGLINGNHRYRWAKDKGFTTIPAQRRPRSEADDSYDAWVAGQEPKKVKLLTAGLAPYMEKEIPSGIQEAYMEGWCYALAEALHRRFGFPIYGVFDEEGAMMHAFVVNPATGRGLDIRGDFDLDYAWDSSYTPGSTYTVRPSPEGTGESEESIQKAMDTVDEYFLGDEPKRAKLLTAASSLYESIDQYTSESIGLPSLDELLDDIPAYDRRSGNRNHMQALYDHIVSLHDAQGPLQVYRAIALPEGTESFRAESFGAFWSWDDLGAKAYYPEQSHHPVYVFQGEVARESVDWWETAKRALCNEEMEVRVTEGAKVKLDGWRMAGDDEWHALPGERRNVTAGLSKNPPTKPETVYPERSNGWALFPDQRGDNVAPDIDKLVPEAMKT